MKAEVSPSDSSTQVKEIQGDNVLTLSFTHNEHIALDVDDYCDFEGERYWLTEAYRPEQKSTLEWVYDIKLYGIESMIRNFLVLKRVDGENDPVFTLTAPPREHVAMIVNCMNDGMGHITDWKVGQVDGAENIVIDYHGKYCDEALREIAEKVGAEWWVEGQTVNVCRCQHGEQIELGHDKGLTGIAPDKADNVKFYTRLFPVGSSRNIDPEKYGYTRLQLPGGEKYVEVNADKYGRVDHYEDVAFADIYPRRTGEVSSVRSEEKAGEDGKPFTIYYFRDNNLPFDPNDYEIGGLVKRVSFQEGSELGGLGDEDNGTYYFEVNFNSDTREFEIVTIWPYDDDTQLPGGSLIPKAGDKYILWNIRMPDEYYALAEEELLAAVNKYNEEHAIDVTVFKCPTDHVWIEDNGADLFVGRRVRLESVQFFPETGYRDSRITKITRKVNLPSSMDIEIGDALSRTSMQKMSDNISDARSYAKSIRDSIALPDIIRTGDKTLPTDNNLFSARRSQREFISKNSPDRAKKKIIFEEGIDFGPFIAGASGAAVDAAGNGEFESVTVRGAARFMELVYNRLNALEGNTSFADVGTVEEIAASDDGTLAAEMRRRWEGDFTAFQPGDVVYSYINRLDSSGEHHKAWAWVKAVDRAANRLTLVAYPDAEVPSGRNFPMAASQIITRWGNNIEANALTAAAYPAFIVKDGKGGYVNTRQSTFYISCDDGNIVELTGVDRPVLSAENYGAVLGKIPAGLLDASTSELVNSGQPYFYARGIIVQDLIRIGYNGKVERTANYRGVWSAATAADPAEGYRSTASSYDVVSWQGDLWQCVVPGTADEPSEASAGWVNMTGWEGRNIDMWQILPEPPTLRPADRSLSVSVLLTSTAEGTIAFTGNYGLAARGVSLYYSLDGSTWQPLMISPAGPLLLEDASGIIRTEATADDICLEGDAIDMAAIADCLLLELRDDADSTVLARASVPVVRDGERGEKGEPGKKGEDGKDGLPGRDGLMVYPDGYFDPDKTYTATAETAPVVMYGATEDARRYYVLRRGATYSAAQMPANRRTPAGDVAYGGEDARWQVFDSFNAVFADIIMAEFGRLGGAVFVGDWMISREGTDASGAFSKNYEKFRTGEFTPNFAIDFKTGTLTANLATIKGVIEAESGKIGGFGIGPNRIGADLDKGENGMALYSEFIRFINADSTKFAWIGTKDDTSSGTNPVGRFYNKASAPLGRNYGLVVNVDNATYNIAISATGNIGANGIVAGYACEAVTLSSARTHTLVFKGSTALVKCTAASSFVCLPPYSYVQNQLGISSGTPFAVRLSIIGHADSTQNFHVVGRNTFISSGYNQGIYPYLLDSNAAQILTTGYEIGRGDTIEFQLVYDGTTYNAYLLNYKTK